MGILALKGLAHWAKKEGEINRYHKVWYHPIAAEESEMARLALNWSYGQGGTAAISPGNPALWDRAFRIAANVQLLTESEMQKLRELPKDTKPIFHA